MTQQAVERALGKLLTDENFRERFFAGPGARVLGSRFAPSPVELIASVLVGFSAWKFRGQMS